jgi:hypothetical protein
MHYITEPCTNVMACDEAKYAPSTVDKVNIRFFISFTNLSTSVLSAALDIELLLLVLVCNIHSYHFIISSAAKQIIFAKASIKPIICIFFVSYP